MSLRSTTEITSVAALRLTKTGPSSVVAGSPIEWLLTVTNDGPSVARAVVVDDPVAAGVVGAIGVPSLGSCDATIECAVGDLAVGAVATVIVRATVDPAWSSGPIVNTATATSPDQPVTEAPTRRSTPTSPARPTSRSRKTLASGGTVAGGPVSWTITVANAGPSTADDVVVTDVLPAAVVGAQATSTAGTCAIDAGTVRCALGTVGLTTVSITVSGTIDPAFRGTLANTATVSSSTFDPTVGDATGTATSPVGGSIDLAITKAVDRPQGLVGGSATFTVVATNLGPSAASNVVVDDQLPDGLTFVAARPDRGTFDATSRRWTIGTLAAGESVTVEIDVTLVAVGNQTNVATVGQVAPSATQALTPTGDDETRLDNNTASATIDVIQPGTELPATGFGGWLVVELGVVALAAGAALVLVARRRRLRRAT